MAIRSQCTFNKPYTSKYWKKWSKSIEAVYGLGGFTCGVCPQPNARWAGFTRMAGLPGPGADEEKKCGYGIDMSGEACWIPAVKCMGIFGLAARAGCCEAFMMLCGADKGDACID